ncbi:hypothetical protein OG618_37815 (plasmid) [Kitasatospora sp. NBC_01246]|nr:hypothetical protein [Kitasatospora sp. NBC_01246]
MSACYTCDSGRYRCPRDEGKAGCTFQTEAENQAAREAMEPEDGPYDGDW